MRLARHAASAGPLLVVVLMASLLCACSATSSDDGPARATSPSGARSTPSPSASPRLVWSDEFDGPAGAAPNPQNWVPQQGGDGWGNGELECNTPVRGNSELNGDGDLVITAIKQPGHICSDGKSNDYTSARLSSGGLQSFTYGTVSIRAQVPDAPGTWPAFWLLGNNHDQVGWPQSGEIDVSEVLGKAPAISHSSLHGPDPQGKAYDLTKTYTAADSLSGGFHIYSATWTDEQISFAVDGQTFYSVTKATLERTGQWVFDQPFYLLIDLAIGGSFPGPPTAATTFPQQFVVDWVRVYQ